MKRNNTDIFDYVAGVLLWTFIIMCWYERFVYMPIPGVSDGRSYKLYLIIVAGIVVVNLLITYRWYRNMLSLVSTVLLPFGVYTFLAYRSVMPVLFTTVYIVVSILSTAYVGYMLNAHSRCINPRRVREIKIKKCFVMVRAIAAFASGLLIACTAALLILSYNQYGQMQNTQFAYTDEYKMDNNMDTVMLLQDDEWKNLSIPERVEVLQCVSHIEGRYLGLTREVAVQVKELSEGVASCYRDSMSTLFISPDIIGKDRSYDALESVCHEMFHAAQHRYVEIYKGLDEDEKKSFFLYDAEVYAEEFGDYDSGDGEDGYKGYYNQKCEEDARKYAENAVRDYYLSIQRTISQQIEAND